MARCPNCDAKISVSVSACPACSADFAVSSAWSPTPESVEEQQRLAGLKAERGAYRRRARSADHPGNPLLLRTAIAAAAIAGNVTHIILAGMATVSGSPQRNLDFAIDVVWFGGPFYLFMVASFLTRSRASHVAMLISLFVVIGLDLTSYFATNSKDWYVVLSPILLFVPAMASLALIYLTSGEWRREDAEED